MKKFMYKNNYSTKVILTFLIAIIFCMLKGIFKFEIIQMPVTGWNDYHSDILTINSIFSGFALTNLGILLSVSDDQLVKKLEGSDILLKRNVVIAHSIIFGAISIFISLVFLLNFNTILIKNIIGDHIWNYIKYFLFEVEVLTLGISILYFILSIKKMIELLSFIYVPKPKLSDEVIAELKNKLNSKE